MREIELNPPGFVAKTKVRRVGHRTAAALEPIEEHAFALAALRPVFLEDAFLRPWFFRSDLKGLGGCVDLVNVAERAAAVRHRGRKEQHAAFAAWHPSGLTGFWHRIGTDLQPIVEGPLVDEE